MLDKYNWFIRFMFKNIYNIPLTIQPAFIKEKTFSFFICFGIVIFWLERKNTIKKIKNGLYFPNQDTLIQTLQTVLT